MPAQLGELLLSSSVMRLLGFNEEAFLAAACKKKVEYHMGAVVKEIENEELQELETLKFTPEFAQTKAEERTEVLDLLESKCREALVDGASATFVAGLRKVLKKYQDVFRTVLGRYTPVNVDPLVVRLKPDHVPVKCKARRYPQELRSLCASTWSRWWRRDYVTETTEAAGVRCH
jgi:hypothetical protein